MTFPAECAILYTMEERFLPIGIQDFEKVADLALSQIDANGYSERFTVSGKKMHKIAVVFSSGGKGIVGWKSLQVESCTS